MAPSKKAKEPKRRTIKRKIFFCRISAGIHPDTGEPREINFGPLLGRLNKMPFTTDGRYLDSDDGKQLCCWPDKLQPPFHLRLANIRRGEYPPVESAGAFTPLILGNGRGLAEITHLTIFSDGICGAEFNFYGPRATQLAYYFPAKLRGNCPPFKLAALVRPDLDERLAKITDIRLLKLKTRASFKSTLEEADKDLGAAFAANIKAVNARPEDEFELIFARKKNKNLIQKSVPNALLKAVRWLAHRPELKEQVSIFKISGNGDQESRFLDILHEQFTVEKTIEPALNESGGVDSSSMYTAIGAAHSELKELLAKAKELE